METTLTNYLTPDEFSPRTEEGILTIIHKHPLPEYNDEPKRAHRRLFSANPKLLSGLRCYFMIGRLPGDFLTGVLLDSFTKAIGHADNRSTSVVKSLSTYLKCYPPSDMWGSEQALSTVKEDGGLVGRYGPETAWDAFINRTL